MFVVSALVQLLLAVIWLLTALVITTAILSWLVAFDVLNVRNPTVYRIVRALDALTEPMLRPIRRFLPNLGGIDISPVILLLILQFIRALIVGAVVRYSVY